MIKCIRALLERHLQSGTKIIGTLADNCTLFNHPSSLHPPPPHFNVVFLWIRRANRATCWLISTLIRGAGSAKCPKLFGHDCSYLTACFSPYRPAGTDLRSASDITQLTEHNFCRLLQSTVKRSFSYGHAYWAWPTLKVELWHLLLKNDVVYRFT